MSSKWLPTSIDVLSVGFLLIFGLFFAGIAIMFRNYGGPPTAKEQGETLRLFAFGASLFISGVIIPLRSWRRALIALALITITAILISLMDGGQPDVESTSIFVLFTGIPLYFLRRYFALKT
jgi:hypothetical protein